MSAKRVSPLFAVFASLCIITPSSVAIEITAWSNSKTGDGALIFKVDPGEPISFSVDTNQAPGEYLWYVNQEQQATTGASFSWTTPADRGTWNVMAEVREANLQAVGVNLGQFAFKVWTVTTTEVRFVGAGEDIQAAIDALPPEGGVVELGSGDWSVAATLPLAPTPESGRVSGCPGFTALQVIDRQNVTLRGQGRRSPGRTFVQAATPGQDVLNISNAQNFAVLDLHVQAASNRTTRAATIRIGGLDGRISHHGIVGGVACVNGDVACIYVEGGKDQLAPAVAATHDILVIDNEVRGGDLTVLLTGYYQDSYDVVVRNNTVESGINGIKFDSTRAHHFDAYNYIDFNVVGAAGTNYGIWIYSGSFNTIARNNVVNLGGIAVFMAGQSVVERNLVNTYSGSHGYASAIAVVGAGATDDNIIRGNIVVNSVARGIGVLDGTGAPQRTLIDGNVVYGSAGDGIYIEPAATTVKNNIVANNTGRGITAPAGVVVSFNDFWNNALGDGADGSGNISAEPLFADPAAGDFHLRSQAGRWDGSGWVLDAVTSPAIDAGDPVGGFSNEPEPNGGRLNMGVHGNTIEASKSAAGPDFSLVCNPSTLTVENGGSATSTCTVRSLVGFNGDVVLSCERVPVGVSCVFSPASLTLAADGSATSDSLVQVAAGVEAGAYRFDVAGTGTSATRRFGIQLTVRGDEVDGGLDGEDASDPGGDDGGWEHSGDAGADGRDASDDEADEKDGGGEDRDGRNGAGVTGGCGCGEAGGFGSGVAVFTLVIMLAGLIVKKTGVGKTRNRCPTRR